MAMLPVEEREELERAARFLCEHYWFHDPLPEELDRGTGDPSEALLAILVCAKTQASSLEAQRVKMYMEKLLRSGLARCPADDGSLQKMRKCRLTGARRWPEQPDPGNLPRAPGAAGAAAEEEEEPRRGPAAVAAAAARGGLWPVPERRWRVVERLCL